MHVTTQVLESKTDYTDTLQQALFNDNSQREVTKTICVEAEFSDRNNVVEGLRLDVEDMTGATVNTTIIQLLV